MTAKKFSEFSDIITLDGNEEIICLENINKRLPIRSIADITNKSDIGLGNVDNTADINKPISLLQQSALNNKADKNHIHQVISVGDIDPLVSNLVIASGSAKNFVITDFDFNSVYVISSELTTSLNSDIITITAPIVSADENKTLTINGKVFTVTVKAMRVFPPNFTTVQSIDAGDGTYMIGIMGDNINSDLSNPVLDNVNWQIALDEGFNTFVYNVSEIPDFTYGPPSHVFSGFAPETTFYIRFRYQEHTLGWSDWSTTYSVTTGAAAPSGPLTEKQIINPSISDTNTTTADNGYSDISGDGNTIAIYSFDHVSNDSNQNVPVVFIYTKQLGVWSLNQILTYTYFQNSPSTDIRRISLDNTGTVLVITDAGGAFIFFKDLSGQFIHTQDIWAPDSDPGYTYRYDKFGQIALLSDNGSRLILGGNKLSTSDSSLISIDLQVYEFTGSTANLSSSFSLPALNTATGLTVDPVTFVTQSVNISGDGTLDLSRIVINTNFYGRVSTPGDNGTLFVLDVYDYVSNEYVHRSKCSDAFDTTPYDRIPSTVSISNNGSVIAVGNYLFDPDPNDNFWAVGKVFIHRDQGNGLFQTSAEILTGELLYSFINSLSTGTYFSGGGAYIGFGSDIKLSNDGSTLFVGAPGIPNITNQTGTQETVDSAGCVAVFKFDGTQFNYDSMFSPSVPLLYMNFGYTLSFNSNCSSFISGSFLSYSDIAANSGVLTPGVYIFGI